jgi:hypothetical protein
MDVECETKREEGLELITLWLCVHGSTCSTPMS